MHVIKDYIKMHMVNTHLQALAMKNGCKLD